MNDAVSGAAPEAVFHTVYAFGSVKHGPYGQVCLKADGRVAVYDHPNERSFIFEHGVLTFLGDTGAPGLRLTHIAHGPAGLFLGDDWHYLLPVITLQRGGASCHSSPLMVNTVPKSGTYLCERILASVGYQALGLHLSRDLLHDNRGVGLGDVHRDVDRREVVCAASAIAAIMRPGDLAVGHLDDPGEIARVEAQGVGMIHCIRDLRDVVVSLMQFKLDVVGPRSAADRLWRSLSGRDRLVGFLSHFGNDAIKDVVACASAIPPESACVLRFEHLVSGVLPEANRAALDVLEPGLGAGFAEALPATIGAATATLSPHRADHREYWSDAAQTFYVESGLRDANRRLGYDAG